jgi:hypothetical protein
MYKLSLQDLLGIKKIGSFSSAKENVDEDILTVRFFFAANKIYSPN